MVKNLVKMVRPKAFKVCVELFQVSHLKGAKAFRCIGLFVIQTSFLLMVQRHDVMHLCQILSPLGFWLDSELKQR